MKNVTIHIRIAEGPTGIPLEKDPEWVQQWVMQLFEELQSRISSHGPKELTVDTVDVCNCAIGGHPIHATLWVPGSLPAERHNWNTRIEDAIVVVASPYKMTDVPKAVSEKTRKERIVCFRQPVLAGSAPVILNKKEYPQIFHTKVTSLANTLLPLLKKRLPEIAPAIDDKKGRVLIAIPYTSDTDENKAIEKAIRDLETHLLQTWCNKYQNELVIMHSKMTDRIYPSNVHGVLIPQLGQAISSADSQYAEIGKLFSRQLIRRAFFDTFPINNPSVDDIVIRTNVAKQNADLVPLNGFLNEVGRRAGAMEIKK